MAKWDTNKEIQLFREYLRIPSVHPNINYAPCIEFLQRQANDLNLSTSICYPVNKENPILIMTWVGSQPELPSIMFNSHMDVVPVVDDQWTHPPFTAHIDEHGKIFGRGTQDMKSVGMQYLAAIRALKRDGIEQMKRTIYITFVPDEEVGGNFGMRPFVKTDTFKALNVGVAFDEACASPINQFFVFYAERTGYAVELICNGEGGHGAAPLKNTCGGKIRILLDKFMDYRNNELHKLELNKNLGIGDVSAVNLTMLNGGMQQNVVPTEMKIVFDIRLAPDVDINAFKKQIELWCDEAGGNIFINFLGNDEKAQITKTDDTNVYWTAFKNAADELGLSLNAAVCPGCTDARFVRQMNIPAFGFTPINNTPITLHAHDEFIFADGYLKGIDIYKKIIFNVANC